MRQPSSPFLPSISNQAVEIAKMLACGLVFVAVAAVLYGRAAREAYAETIASPPAWCAARGLRYVPPASPYGARWCADAEGRAVIPFARHDGI